MKIYYRPRTWIMVALLLIAEGLIAFLQKMYGGDAQGQALSYINAAVSLDVLVFIFAAVIASEIVAGEFTWGTIKLLLIRPASRSKILLSKYIAVLLFLLFLLIVLFVSSVFIGLIVFGTGADAVPVSFGNIVQKYGYNLVELVMNVTFAFMISTVFRSSSLALSLSFLIMFASNTAMAILIGLKKEWAKYILYANTDLSVYAPGNQPPFEGMTLGFSVTMLLLYYVFFIGLSWILFNKRDVAG
jgi:ABC-2 type transport system permease protein